MTNNTGSSSSANRQPQQLGPEERRQELVKLGWWVSIPLSIVSSTLIDDGDYRLDGGFYAQNVIAAQRALQDCGFETKPLKSVVSDIFVLDRFKRIYATNTKKGWPYLSASEALDFHPISNRLIAEDHAPKKASKHFVKQGWILVSASGSVGRMVLTTKRLERFFLTHDLIRVIPDSQHPIGYIYAFLSTWIGQALLSKDQYGSAIKHLEPHQIASVPIPQFDETVQQEISELIKQVYQMRDEANQLLDQADLLLHRELGLPYFDLSQIPYLQLPKGADGSIIEKITPHPKAFEISSNDFESRLDASYHTPVTRTATEKLRGGKYSLKRLGDIAVDISLPPRFKRIYVRKGYGLPFVRPSHLPLNRFYDLGYISYKTDVLDKLLLHQGDILVSTDGTIGQVSLVSSYLDGWAGSNNLARITYSPDGFANGFIAAFLRTPYGYYQLVREIYGGVVDHIEADHVSAVLIPDTPKDVQSSIGKFVVQAYELKDKAMMVEDNAIQLVENGLLRQSEEKR